MTLRKRLTVGESTYNLIHTILAQAASKHEIEPRTISFKGAVQTLEAFHLLLAMQGARSREHRLHLYNKLLDAVATHRVSDRPVRVDRHRCLDVSQLTTPTTTGCVTPHNELKRAKISAEDTIRPFVDC